MPAGSAPTGKPAAIIGQNFNIKTIASAFLEHTPETVDSGSLQADMSGKGWGSERERGGGGRGGRGRE